MRSYCRVQEHDKINNLYTILRSHLTQNTVLPVEEGRSTRSPQGNTLPVTQCYVAFGDNWH